MSAIEYNNLLFEISQRLDEINVRDRLLFMCRGKLAPGSEDNVQDVLSLFKELEEQNYLGTDRLEVMKELLKGVREWRLYGHVKKFERKRQEYNGLLDEIIRVLDELNGVEQLIAMCRRTIPEVSSGQIQDVRSLFKVLENQNNLGIDRLDTLKAILTETDQNDLLKKVEEFEERRNNEDEFERRKAEAAAAMLCATNMLKGVLNIKMVPKVVAAGITIFTIREILRRWSTYDQLVTAFQSCVLPAGAYLVKLTEGSVCFTVRAENLSALTNLWNLYQDGTLERRLYDFLVTDEVRERAGGKEIEVDVIIDEQEYDKACLELIKEVQAGTLGNEKRIRRNSDSAIYLRQREETATIFKQTPVGWKAHQAGEKHERPDEPKVEQRMDPEKFARVQKYVKEVHDTRDDSDYWTQTLESELTESETSDVVSDYLEDQAYEGIRNPYVIIINNANFYHHPHRRNEALYDRDHVRRFVREAGFQSVQEHFDLEAYQMLNVLTHQVLGLVDHDSLICIIMSLGDEERILGVDGRAIPVEQITATFQGDMCPQLRNKPKLFFLEVRKVEGYYVPGWQGYPYGMRVTNPPDADFLIAFSNTPYNPWSPVMQLLGSPFISCLMQILQANSHKQDLMTMLTRVNEVMSASFPFHLFSRAPYLYQRSTLTKKVYFPNFQKPESTNF